MKKMVSIMFVFLMLFLVISSVVLGLTEQVTEDVKVSKTEIVVKKAAEFVTKAFSEEEDKVAVLFGMYDYPGTDSDLEGPPNDVAAMQDVLEEDGYSVYVYENVSEASAVSAMETQFAGAGEEDTLLFYYSGHGGSSGEESVLWFTDSVSYAGMGMTVTELKSTLDEYTSTKVVLLDSCYSGGFVNRSITTEDELDEATEEFNQNVIDIFETADSNTSRYLNTSTYKVITACAGDEYSWEGTLEGEKRGYFTYYYTKGCGYFNSYNVLPADDNTNTEITQTEIFNYTYDNIISINFLSGEQYYIQTVKTYPYESGDPDYIMFSGDAVNVSVETNGYGSISEGSTYTLLEGNDLTITPIPDSGYYTKSAISSNGNTVTDNEDGTWTIENITADDTITVTFDTIAEVTVAVSGNGSIEEGINHTILDGGDLKITPDADTGWYVNSVISATDNTVTDNGDGTWTIENITTDDTITVTFETTADVSINVAGNGSITEGTTHTVLDGGDLTITPVAGNGYDVQSVVSANGNTVTDNGNGTWTIENITADDTVIVTFMETDSVNISIKGNGSITEGTTHTVFDGDNLTITPVPDSSWYVKSVVSVNGNTVIDNGDGTYTIVNITTDDTVTVTFDTTAEVTVAVSGNGSISEGTSHTVLDGGNLTITPVPETGNAVLSVISANGNTVTDNLDGTYTIVNITTDDTVTVTFDTIADVLISVVGNGSIAEGLTHIVLDGEDLTITPIADTGWYVKSVVSTDGNTVTDNGNDTYTIENIIVDDTITVTFDTTADVSIHISGYGNIDEGTSHFVLDGGNLIITPVPDTGWYVKEVVSNNGNIVKDNGDGTWTIENITADDTVTVKFEEKANIYSATVDKESAETGSYFTFTIETNADTDKLAFYSECVYHSQLTTASSGVIRTVNDETATWTYTIKVGKTGERTFSFKAHNSAGWSQMADVNFTVTEPQPPEISSVTVDKASAVSGSIFTFLIETDADTDRIAFYSEGVYYSQLTTSSSGVTKTVNGDTAIWTYKIKVGKTGERTFSFKTHNIIGWSKMEGVIFTVTEPQLPKITDGTVNPVDGEKGSHFTFTIETSSDVNYLNFYADSGEITYKYIRQLTTSTSGVTRTVDGDTAIWTYVIKIGTTGERFFSFKAHNGAGLSNYYPIYFTVNELTTPVIDSVTVDKAEGNAGEIYTFKITTNESVDYLALYTNTSTKDYRYIRRLYKTTSGVSVKINNDGTATWTYKIKIGATGNRMFSFKAHNSTGWSGYESVNFIVR